MLGTILLYIIIGVLEYFRVVKDYQKNLQEDFPFHPIALLEFCIFSVCLIFGPALLVIKLLTKLKKYLKNIWRKLTFFFRIRKFSKKLGEISKEEDSRKSALLLLRAMKEMLK